MSAAIDIVPDDLFTVMRAFIQSLLPGPPEVFQGLGNRVSMPTGDAFVVMTGVLQQRLRTNVDDTAATGSPTPAPGTLSLNAGLRFDMQLDFYGPLSGSWSALLAAALRDPLGCDALAPACQPLYADDIRMVPLITGEEQYLERWTLTAVLQYNPTVTLPQQYSVAAAATLINVDEAYPP